MPTSTFSSAVTSSAKAKVGKLCASEWMENPPRRFIPGEKSFIRDCLLLRSMFLILKYTFHRSESSRLDFFLLENLCKDLTKMHNVNSAGNSVFCRNSSLVTCPNNPKCSEIGSQRPRNACNLGSVSLQ